METFGPPPHCKHCGYSLSEQIACAGCGTMAGVPVSTGRIAVLEAKVEALTAERTKERRHWQTKETERRVQINGLKKKLETASLDGMAEGVDVQWKALVECEESILTPRAKRVRQSLMELSWDAMMTTLDAHYPPDVCLDVDVNDEKEPRVARTITLIRALDKEKKRGDRLKGMVRVSGMWDLVDLDPDTSELPTCPECGADPDSSCSTPDPDNINGCGIEYGSSIHRARLEAPVSDNRSGVKVGKHVDGGLVWTWCSSCGPNVAVDEDGCCTTCGIDAVFYGDMETPRTPLMTHVEEAWTVLRCSMTTTDALKSDPGPDETLLVRLNAAALNEADRAVFNIAKELLTIVEDEEESK